MKEMQQKKNTKEFVKLTKQINFDITKAGPFHIMRSVRPSSALTGVALQSLLSIYPM